MSPPPLKYQGGRKKGKKNQENERKIKNSSNIFNRQKTSGPKPMSFCRGDPLTPNFSSGREVKWTKEFTKKGFITQKLCIISFKNIT